jgi:hypothetical protein
MASMATNPVQAASHARFMRNDLWEWVEDRYREDYAGAPADGSAWTTGMCQTNDQVLRGGYLQGSSPIFRRAVEARGRQSFPRCAGGVELSGPRPSSPAGLIGPIRVVARKSCARAADGFPRPRPGADLDACALVTAQTPGLPGALHPSTARPNALLACARGRTRQSLATARGIARRCGGDPAPRRPCAMPRRGRSAALASSSAQPRWRDGLSRAYPHTSARGLWALG